jgi:hypothetical protein
LLGGGLLAFLACYVVYAFFLGGIDGLALLPEHLGPGELQEIADVDDGQSGIDGKLRMAFGRECNQVKKHFKFEIRKKGLVIAAAEASFKEPDGRVKLTDFSLAMFKDPGDGLPPEINTIQSDYAFLSFDQRITSPADMDKAHIIGGELRSRPPSAVVLINNRRTLETHDDLEVMVDQDSLFYDEQAGKIWTDGYVTLLDKKTQPHPTRVKGRGMDLQLTREPPAGKKVAKAAPKGDASGVDRITLRSTVRMDLYPDSNSGFVGGNGKAPPAAPGKAPAKDHVVITTQGQFTFDVVEDVARFDSPPPNPSFPDQVSVIREPLRDPSQVKEGDSQDHLLCDHLTLKFRRKQPPPGAGRPGERLGDGPGERIGDRTGGDREIESAHATITPGAGTEVVLSLDSENLACYCNELVYECATAERGSRTVLKGEPLEAARDGHKIKARRMTLVSADAKGRGQHVIADGPGQVDLFDRTPGKGYTTHALWKGLLTTTKYKEGERDLDLLTLTEDAAFIDDEHEQKLYGQRLQVWLESSDTPAQATPAGPKQETAVGGSRQRPVKVEAYERVRAESPDLKVSDCASLKIRFKDDPRSNGSLPEVGAAFGASAPGALVPAEKPSSQPPGALDPGLPMPGPPGSDPRGLTPPVRDSQPAPDPRGLTPPARQDVSPPPRGEPTKPKRPIDLKARDVIADVLRSGEKNDLQELVALGNVRVHQDGEKPGDKGVDIDGETLKLLHNADGDVLRVFGNDKGPAHLHLGELILIGPNVLIDQRVNTAAVEGVGLMHMPSNTSFDGGKPNKQGTRLTISWTHDMLFSLGKDADFNGGVIAYQDGSEMRCNTLQVTLDKVVSFKEGQKEGQGAKVQKIMAHGKVSVLDVVKDDKDQKVIAQRLLTCNQLEVDNEDNLVNATGPGTVCTLQYGTPEAGPGNGPKGPKQQPPPNANAKPAELMLTRVEFRDRMFSRANADNSARDSKFMGFIHVYHFPAETLEAQVDSTKLPKGGLYLECDNLRVVSQQTKDKKTAQTMEAKQRVFVRTPDMYGRSDTLVFDDTNDIVILNGAAGNPAAVYQQLGGPGGKTRETRAGQILYNRKTGAISADRIEGVNGSWAPEILPPFDVRCATFDVRRAMFDVRC